MNLTREQVLALMDAASENRYMRGKYADEPAEAVNYNMGWCWRAFKGSSSAQREEAESLLRDWLKGQGD